MSENPDYQAKINELTTEIEDLKQQLVESQEKIKVLEKNTTQDTLSRFTKTPQKYVFTGI